MSETLMLFPLKKSIVKKLNSIMKNIPGIESTTDAIMWAIDNVPLRTGDTGEEEGGSILNPGSAKRLLQFGDAHGILAGKKVDNDSLMKVVIDETTLAENELEIDEISEIRLTRE